MTRFSILIVVGLTLAAGAQTAPQASTLPPEVTPESLLKRSYDLSRGLDLRDRGEVLAKVARAAARRHLKQARPWIEELYALGPQYPALDRDYPEGNAAAAMAEIDAPRALAMLLQIQEPPIQPDQPYIDVRASAARAVFEKVFENTGAVSVAKLRAVAQQMGQTGQYPYSAWNRIMPRLEEGATRQEIFADAVAAYGNSVANDAGEADFRSFVAHNWGLVPSSMARSAVEQAVNRLVEQDASTNDGKVRERWFTAKGVAQFSTPEQTRLFFLVQVAQQVDPELVAQLKEKYPVLRQPALQDPDPRTLNYVPQRRADEKPLGDTPLPAAEQRGRAMAKTRYLTSKDPDSGIAFARSIPDPLTRSECLAQAAEVVAGEQPQTARDLLEEAKKSAGKIAEPAEQFLAWSHIADTARTLHSDPDFIDAAQRALAVAPSLTSSTKKEGRENSPISPRVVEFWLNEMIPTLARLNSASALSLAEAVPDPKTKAILLAQIAENLSPSHRPGDR